MHPAPYQNRIFPRMLINYRLYGGPCFWNNNVPYITTVTVSELASPSTERQIIIMSHQSLGETQ